MQKSKYNDRDRNMRRRFCEQIIRFWQKCKQKDEGDSLGVEEYPRNVRPQDDRSEQPTPLSHTE